MFLRILLRVYEWLEKHHNLFNEFNYFLNMADVHHCDLDLPPFLFEGKPGKFAKVKKISGKHGLFMDGDVEFYDSGLILGKDIEEIPTGDLTLLLTATEHRSQFLPCLYVPRLQEFAQLSWSDYVSYKPSIKGGVTTFIHDDFKNRYYAVQPRLFRTIRNN